MNILAAAQFEQMKLEAGGPGSGRHAGSGKNFDRAEAHYAAAMAHKDAAKAVGTAQYADAAAKAHALTTAANDSTKTDSAHYTKETAASHAANQKSSNTADRVAKGQTGDNYFGGSNAELKSQHDTIAGLHNKAGVAAENND